MLARLFFDGAAEPTNPGPIGAGFVLTMADGERFGESIDSDLVGTSNTAEYLALIAGLERARQAGVDEIEVIGDSLLVVRQVQGIWRTNAAHRRLLRERVRVLAPGFRTFSIFPVPREHNEEAHRLSRVAAQRSTARVPAPSGRGDRSE